MTERETESPEEKDREQPDGAEGWGETNDEPAQGEGGQESV